MTTYFNAAPVFHTSILKKADWTLIKSRYIHHATSQISNLPKWQDQENSLK